MYLKNVLLTVRPTCVDNLYSIKSPLKLVYSRKELQPLYLILHLLHFLASSPDLHLILWIHSEILLTRFYNEVAINLVLSKKFDM